MVELRESASGEGRIRPDGPLAGLVVVDLSTTLPGAQTTQFLADAGADVLLLEGPSGSPLRHDPGWPALLRGKRSAVLDVWSDRESFERVLAGADVLVTTMRPGAAESLGLTAERLGRDHPRLVTAAITGWGSRGPWRDYKGYEALVMAKAGVLHSKRQLSPGPDPAFVSVPYASFAAAQVAVQGILAALFERESSGLGQFVESNLLSGVGAMDTYNWFYEMILRRYPDAFQAQVAAFDESGRPQSRLMYALLVAATKDGTWLQFAHSSPRLMAAWLAELGLDEEVKDPRWAGFPDLPTAELRQEWWDKMLSIVGDRTLAEWESVFARDPNVFGEQFRTPVQALEHPQLVHDGRVVMVKDPDLGGIRQPSTMVHAGDAPLTHIRPAPRLGEHAVDTSPMLSSTMARGAEEAPITSAPSSEARPPLDGVTIVELGGMFAGPFGATVLAELGARIIKFEPLEGDPIRTMMAFPEAGGGKVLQGKESVAADLRTAEGRAILYRIVEQADIVLQCFRAGVAERVGADEASLREINPDIVYLNAPGYGIGGPYGAKPAYAPSIGAASGVSVTDAQCGNDVVESLDDVRRGARARWAGGAVPAVQSDGIAALGVASGMMLGLYARARGVALPGLTTTMLATCSHALIARSNSYPEREQDSTVDAEFRGLGPLYRLYPASDGWIFLAVSTETEWADLRAALPEAAELADERFATAAARAAHGAMLAQVLEKVFATRSKDVWESTLTARDVGCVAVCQENAEWRMQDDEFYDAGYAVDAVSPIFGEHRRTAPLARFSRSTTRAEAGCTIGQHTDEVLREFGYDTEAIVSLRAQNIIG